MNLEISLGTTDENIANLVAILNDLKEKQTEILITINDGRIKKTREATFITGVYNRFATCKSKVNNYYDNYSIKLVDFLLGKVSIEVK